MRTLAPEAEIFSTSPLMYDSSSSRNCDSMLGSVIWIFASTSVFFTSIAELTKAIFAFSTTLGIPEWTLSLSSMIPSTRELSLIEPPCFFSTFTSSKSTNIPSPSSWATAITALTQMSERNSLTAPALFPVNAVLATSARVISFTSIAWESMRSIALSDARRNPSQMTVGWTFCSIKSSDLLRSSPARTTAVVVPSKQCCSCVLAISMIIFAAGCSMSISFRMVAPSLVITTSPMLSTSILSIPFGPNVDLTASATAFAAAMLLLCAVLPLVRVVPSFKIKIGCCELVIQTPLACCQQRHRHKGCH